MAHCNQYFCCLYRTVYNKKRKYLQKPLTCQFDFFFLFLSFETERKHSFFWEEWTGYIDLSFVFNHFCIFPTPNSIWSSRCVGVAPQAVVVCTSVGGSMVVGVERWGNVGYGWGKERGGAFLRAGEGGGGCGGGTWNQLGFLTLSVLLSIPCSCAPPVHASPRKNINTHIEDVTFFSAASRFLTFFPPCSQQQFPYADPWTSFPLLLYLPAVTARLVLFSSFESMYVCANVCLCSKIYFQTYYPKAILSLNVILSFANDNLINVQDFSKWWWRTRVLNKQLTPNWWWLSLAC